MRQPPPTAGWTRPFTFLGGDGQLARSVEPNTEYSVSTISSAGIRTSAGSTPNRSRSRARRPGGHAERVHTRRAPRGPSHLAELGLRGVTYPLSQLKRSLHAEQLQPEPSELARAHCGRFDRRLFPVPPVRGRCREAVAMEMRGDVRKDCRGASRAEIADSLVDPRQEAALPFAQADSHEVGAAVGWIVDRADEDRAVREE